MKSDLKIIIIDEDEIWRKGCELMLSEIDEFLVIGNYSTFASSKKDLKNGQPQLILLGLNSPNTNGIEIIPEIKKIHQQIDVIILTMYNNSEMIFESFKMGATGYLSKNIGIEKLTDAIKEVVNGGAVVSSGAAKIVVGFFQKNHNSPLTKRETEIMQCMSEGQTKAQMASELFINQNTVRSHVKNIYIKLNVRSKSEAIKMAKKMRFI